MASITASDVLIDSLHDWGVDTRIPVRSWHNTCSFTGMIRKLKSGDYRLYSRKADPKTGRRRNLGTFGTREAAEKHERAVQFFKRAH
jgi:hypothetical protein